MKRETTYSGARRAMSLLLAGCLGTTSEASAAGTLNPIAVPGTPFYLEAVQYGNCCRGYGTMNGMMNGMMMGGAVPGAIDPAQLPDPNAPGAKLAAQYCSQCHGLPSPELHSPEGWPAVVQRMNSRMQWMTRNSNMAIRAPSDTELQTILTYFRAHAASAAPR